MEAMTQIIGDILNSTPLIRKNIIAACGHLKFEGDNHAIMETIYSLKVDFDYVDLYNAQPVTDRNRLIAYCMEIETKAQAKIYITKLRRKKDTRHIAAFKRFL